MSTGTGTGKRLSLMDLARRIDEEHHAAEEAVGAALAHARQAGVLLLEAKGRCKHGEWLPWLSKNVSVAERTVQAYMRVAENWTELESKAQSTADLTLQNGLRLLTDGGRNGDGEEPASVPDVRPARMSNTQADQAAAQVEAEALVEEALGSLSAEDQLQVIEAQEKKILDRAARSSKPPPDRRRVRLDRCNRWVKSLRKDLKALGGEAETALEIVDRIDQAIADLEEAA